MASHSLPAAGVNFGIDSTCMIFVPEALSEMTLYELLEHQASPVVSGCDPGRVRRQPRAGPPPGTLGRLGALGGRRWWPPSDAPAGCPARNVGPPRGVSEKCLLLVIPSF